MARRFSVWTKKLLSYFLDYHAVPAKMKSLKPIENWLKYIIRINKQGKTQTFKQEPRINSSWCKRHIKYLNVQDVQTQRPKVASRDHKTRQENDGDVNPLDEHKRKPRTVNALDEYKRKRMQTTFFDRLFTAIIMILGSGSLWELQLPFQC